jgi:hypothetical protein
VSVTLFGRERLEWIMNKTPRYGAQIKLRHEKKIELIMEEQIDQQ